MNSKNITTEIIVEVAQSHDGSLGILHSLIDAISGTGVDTIKFQTHIAAAESSEYEPFRVHFSYEDETRSDYWKRMEFTRDQWVEIKKHCEEKGLHFLSSPFSCAAVDLLESIGIKRYKVGSGEVRNYLMLEKIANTGKDVILSSGMSDFVELERTVHFLQDFNCEVSILQCTTEYPTTAETIGLNLVHELTKRFKVPIGFSDHSGNIFSGLAATTLGAEILEVHVTFDKRMFGPDASSSLTINELNELVKGVRFINKAQNKPVDKNDVERFDKVKSMFDKSLSVNKNMIAGEIICTEDLESKKPAGFGVSAADYKQVIGRKLRVDKLKYEFLREKDLV